MFGIVSIKEFFLKNTIAIYLVGSNEEMDRCQESPFVKKLDHDNNIWHYLLYVRKAVFIYTYIYNIQTICIFTVFGVLCLDGCGGAFVEFYYYYTNFCYQLS